MTIANISSRFGVQIDVADPSVPVNIGGITRQNIETGSDVREEMTSGDVYPRHQAMYAQKPVAQFTSYALADLLAACGLTGLLMANGGVNYYAQHWLDGSTPKGTLSHRKYNILSGVLIPRRISVQHQGDATIEYEHLITYDGTNEPIVITDSITLPTGVDDDQRFTLYDCKLGNVTLSQVQSFDVEFGVDGRTEGGDSDIWDTFSRLRGFKPRLTVVGTDVEWWKSSNIPLVGKLATHANTLVRLRKRSGTGFVADATGQHISFTGDGLAYIQTGMSDQGDDAATITVEMPLRYDGTNSPLAISTTAVLT